MARLVPVVSSALTSMSYDRTTGRLIVQFSEDSFYEYDSVPGDVVLDVMFADSHGQAFDRLVKKGGFGYRRVHRDQALA